ncbi:hypothetical protein B1756_09565 [Natrarchaeobaculum aegyptiacum]|uniref:DUF4350 domain-containing protein n=2 Tax=Natrarchaeobaculum aegyptiacum TaxID=745377 RepID=A0A2Z2HWN7_9EURY|nr:hypothetical protein B1756_09565 [Natrarchaeobaculum aegyptiacum]
MDAGRSLEVDWTRLLTYGLAGAVLITLLVGATTSTVAFGLFNPAWDGATDLRGQLDSAPGAEPVVVRETGSYGDHSPTETTAFVVAPEEPYDRAAMDDVAAFVEAGGTLVVMDDGTAGNRLLEGVGADARFDGRVVRDEREYDQGPQMPVVTAVADDALVATVDEVTLNRGTAIETGDDEGSAEWNASGTDDEATVLLGTSEYASLSPTGSDREPASVAPPSGPYPVATVESVGDGRVVAVGDPSIAINVMVDRSDNEAFLHALAGDGTVLFDRSHGGDLPPLSSAALTIRESPSLQALVGFGAIFGVVAATSRRGRRVVTGVRSRCLTLVAILAATTASDTRPSSASAGDDRSRLSPAAQARYLRSNHPEWDEELIEGTIGKFNMERDEHIGRNDE